MTLLDVFLVFSVIMLFHLIHSVSKMSQEVTIIDWMSDVDELRVNNYDKIVNKKY